MEYFKNYNMTPQEKAKELVDKMMLYSFEKEDYIDDFPKYIVNYKIKKEYAKQCALISVDEIMRVCPYFDLKIRETEDQLSAFDFQFVSYWEEVKKEIEKL